MLYSLGELLVEVFRKEKDLPFSRPGTLLGPFASGAPAIFTHVIANLGYPCGFFATIGEDDFGDCLINKVMTIKTFPA